MKVNKFKRPRRTSKKISSAHFGMKKRFCRFCADKLKTIDYKDAKRLESFITERGKIVSSRISGNCAKHQRVVLDAIRKARFISILPYVR